MMTPTYRIPCFAGQAATIILVTMGLRVGNYTLFIILAMA